MKPTMLTTQNPTTAVSSNVARASWRCGTSWADANSKCGTPCPQGDTTTIYTKTFQTTYEILNFKSAMLLAGDTGDDCVLDEKCFRDLAVSPCSKTQVNKFRRIGANLAENIVGKIKGRNGLRGFIFQ